MLRKFNPPQVVILFFLLMIGIGTLLLMHPVSTISGLGLPPINALFMSTSAVCVTGLCVINPALELSFFGQCVLLFLVQVGGLGIMTISVFFAVIIGRRLSIKNKLALIREHEEEIGGLGKLIKSIVFLTMAIEVMGAFLIFYFLGGFQSDSPEKILFSSFFHAICAFCNAGFSLFKDNLETIKNNYPALVTIMGLIIFGGLGFSVLGRAIYMIIPRKRKEGYRRLNLQSKIVIYTSFWLILGGALVLFLFDHERAFKGYSLGEKVVHSFFQSVTARTAGFNSMPIGLFSDASLFCLVILMFIGASPGSTGGGVKTSTFMVILASIRAMFKGQSEASLFFRTISFGIIREAFAIISIALLLVCGVTILVCLVEPYSFIQNLFEVTSAFGTVGLSTGITPDLTDWSKVLLIMTMFVGRLGPVTIAFALASKTDAPAFRYPDEKVMVG